MTLLEATVAKGVEMQLALNTYTAKSKKQGELLTKTSQVVQSLSENFRSMSQLSALRTSPATSDASQTSPDVHCNTPPATAFHPILTVVKTPPPGTLPAPNNAREPRNNTPGSQHITPEHTQTDLERLAHASTSDFHVKTYWSSQNTPALTGATICPPALDVTHSPGACIHTPLQQSRLRRTSTRPAALLGNRLQPGLPSPHWRIMDSPKGRLATSARHKAVPSHPHGMLITTVLCFSNTKAHATLRDLTIHTITEAKMDMTRSLKQSFITAATPSSAPRTSSRASRT
jgi:hypothetical protein